MADKFIYGIRYGITAAFLSAALCVTMTGCGSAKKYYNKGVDAYKAKNYETALADFESAVEEAPDYALYRFNVIYAKIKLGTYDDAAKAALGLVRDSNVRSILANNKKAYYLAALAHFMNKEYDDAYQNVQSAQAIDISADFDDGLDKLGLLSALMSQNDASEPENIINEVNAMYPDNEDMHYILAKKLFEAGKYELAVNTAFPDYADGNLTDIDTVSKAYFVYCAQVLIGNDSAADSIAELIMKLVPADSYEKSVYDYINFMYDGKNEGYGTLSDGLKVFESYSSYLTAAEKIKKIAQYENDGDYENALKETDGYLELFPEDASLLSEEKLLGHICD